MTAQAWQLTCQRVVEKYCLDIDSRVIADKITEVNDSIWNDENKRPKGNFSFYELRKRIVQEALKVFDIYHNQMTDDLVSQYSKSKYESIYVFEDVKETLKVLKQRGYIITLLTNGDSQVQREKLKRFELESYFDGIFIDGEQGVGKPEKQAYDNILQKFNILPQNACMIGDHYLWEVIAPKKYGLHAIWVNRIEENKYIKEKVQPDYIIYNIGELLKIYEI